MDVLHLGDDRVSYTAKDNILYDNDASLTFILSLWAWKFYECFVLIYQKV